MCGSFGRLSEKARDSLEPVATARSQSFFVAFSFSLARKMPFAFDVIFATDRQLPPLPWRR
jgi:hypothetical protein